MVPAFYYCVIPALVVGALFVIAKMVLGQPQMIENRPTTQGATGSDSPAGGRTTERKVPASFIVAAVVAVLYSAVGVFVVASIIAGTDPLVALALVQMVPAPALAGLVSMGDVLVSVRRPHTARYRRLQWIGLALCVLLFPLWYGTTVLVTQLVLGN